MKTRKLGFLPLLSLVMAILASHVFFIRFPLNVRPINALYDMNITSTPPPPVSPNHKLRLDWTNVPLASPMAKRIHAHMNNCSLPLGTFEPRNRMGLGSDLHVWSQVLCNSMEENVRLWTLLPWQWRDQESCGADSQEGSSLQCYFGSVELRCKQDGKVHLGDTAMMNAYVKVSSPYLVNCSSIVSSQQQVTEFRAAAMEYLFANVSPLVIREAERQLNLVFHNNKQIPSNLITVQIRWGDKEKEMKLVPAHHYVKGVQQILEKRRNHSNPTASLLSSPVSIYLATEDPKAVQAFRLAAPPEWIIYVDQYYHDMLPFRNKERNVYNQGPKTARATNGRAGLVALASLLVAMEANDFVLTTASNWSRLMNELRKNVLDPQCHHCTSMVDLKYGEW